MTKYIVSINEQSKRGKLVKQLLNELKSKKDVRITSISGNEKAEDAIIAREINKGKNTSSFSLEEAKKEILKIRKKLSK